MTPSTLIGIYLLISLPFDVVRLRTFYLLRGFAARSIANLLSLSVAIKSGVLITEAVEKRGILLEPYRGLPPEATSGIYNQSVFWWLNPLLRIGFGKTLQIEDLYNLDEDLASTNVENRFKRAWATVKEPQCNSLFLTTLYVLRWEILLAGFPRLFLIAAKYAQPFLIQDTIQYVSDRDGQAAATGWGLTGAFFLIYFAVAIFTASYRHLSSRFATQIRAGLISLLYNKTLELSLVSNDPSASLTLMSSDVQAIVEPFILLHDTWGGIVELGLAMYLLYRNLGGSAVYAPAIVYILSIICTGWVISVIASFQKRWLDAVQTRVSFTSSLLHSVRNVKLLGLSSVVEDRTQGLREKEIIECKKYRIVNLVQIVAQNVHVVLAPFATFLLYYIRSRESGQVLDLATAFSILAIFRLVEDPFNTLVLSAPRLASSLSCFQRIQQYLLSESRHDNRLSLQDVQDSDESWGIESHRSQSIQLRQLGGFSGRSNDEVLSLRNCSFGWDVSSPPVVRDIDVSFRAGSLNMIIGPVGSGKSTLLKGILSETPLSHGFVYIRNQSIAFADQEPWIQNGTIQDAVRGPSSRDLPYQNDRWYDEVVNCCGLSQDLTSLPQGDRTFIGSKGISLSGGQKQRLALARAVYSKAEILILDDVFSGLDNDTEEHIFRKLFSHSGPLRRFNTTVILVTHAVHRLTYADLILSLDGTGRIAEQGNYAHLSKQNGYVHSLDVRFKEEPGRLAEEDEHPSEPTKVALASATAESVEDENRATQDLMRRTGDWRTYKDWFQSCGYFSSTLSVMWSFLWVITAQAPGVLIKFFGNTSSQATIFIIIFGLACAASMASIILLVCQIFLDMQPRSSSSLHLKLLKAVLNAPLSFFTHTDIGSITNRFSQDMTLVDVELPVSFADFILALVSCVISLGLVGVSGTGYFAAIIPVILVALYAIQMYYLRTSRQLRLLDLEEKAPLYTLFGETAAGLASIRGFGWTTKFAERNRELLDRSQRPFYLMYCIQRWLGLVLDLLVAMLVTILMVMIVLRRHSIQPGFVGLGLLTIVNLSSSLTYLVRFWTLLETSIGAISRLRDFAKNTKSEHKAWESDRVNNQWPENGEVVFNSFEASYSSDSALVLKDIDLDIHFGEKLGICGKSGAGKSSVLSSLFHLLEYRSGKIQIDGIDISRIPRETLRARLNVIPQEPWWITTESVRYNMDPWTASNVDSSNLIEYAERDAGFISALTQCQIWPVIVSKGGLDAIMTHDFLSHGQRQLFCLARALVRTSKVVVLDEVSANVDVKTDELMQRIIREKFRDCTVIAVAHRLNTIVDFERIVVLGKGQIVEVGEPQRLLQTTGSAFKGLYES